MIFLVKKTAEKSLLSTLSNLFFQVKHCRRNDKKDDEHTLISKTFTVVGFGNDKDDDCCKNTCKLYHKNGKS